MPHGGLFLPQGYNQEKKHNVRSLTLFTISPTKEKITDIGLLNPRNEVEQDNANYDEHIFSLNFGDYLKRISESKNVKYIPIPKDYVISNKDIFILASIPYTESHKLINFRATKLPQDLTVDVYILFINNNYRLIIIWRSGSLDEFEKLKKDLQYKLTDKKNGGRTRRSKTRRSKSRRSKSRRIRR
jgi:hypothetical protein